jgi:hypothetical protein
VLRVYLDESYDNSVMCIGGWLCTEEGWKRLEGKWLERIAYECRISEKHGHPPISRYHATDCANLKREFAESKGWTIPRQIRLVKSLIKILGTTPQKPIGIAVGLSLKELKIARADLSNEQLKAVAYFLCMCECFYNIGNAMDECFLSERVMVFHDSSDKYNKWAVEAYTQMFTSNKFRHYARYFVGNSPASWKDHPALQPADLIAYEGLKLTAARKRGSDDLRKSLQGIIGHGIGIRAGFYKPDGLPELAGFFSIRS